MTTRTIEQRVEHIEEVIETVMQDPSKYKNPELIVSGLQTKIALLLK
jgi:hypothetical protein